MALVWRCLFAGEGLDFVEINGLDGGSEGGFATVVGVDAGSVGKHVLGEGEGDNAVERGAFDGGGGGGRFADVGKGDFEGLMHFFREEGEREKVAVGLAGEAAVGDTGVALDP